MKKIVPIVCLALLGFQAFSQNVGIGTNSPNSKLEVNGSFATKINTVTATTTLDGTYSTVVATPGSGYTITLPTIALSVYRIYTIVYNGTSGGNAITIQGAGSENIAVNGANSNTFSLTGGTITLQNDGTVWRASTQAPSSGSNAYIQNNTIGTNFTTGQTGSFDIKGSGEISGTLSVGGNGTGATPSGAVLDVIGGTAVSGDGKAINLTAQTGNGSGTNGGHVNVNAGNGTTGGFPGNVNINAGTGPTAGNVNINSTGGNVNVASGTPSQTVDIANSSTGTKNVTIGGTSAASSTTINGGSTGGVKIGTLNNGLVKSTGGILSNGVVAADVPTTNALSITGTTVTSTVNGVNSNGLDIASAITSKSPWNIAGGTTPATTITDNMYHTGNVTVGDNTSPARLYVKGDGTNPMFSVVDNTAVSKVYVDPTGKVGINTNSPNTSLDVRTSDAIQFPVGATTGATGRPASPQAGFTRFNTDSKSLEYYDGTQWVSANTTQVPVGTISPYGGSSAPSGWLLCDGSPVSRTTYVDLFNAIGISFGPGNGTTTFNLPNLQGRAAVGLGSAPYNTLGGTGGSTTVTPSLSHSLSVDIAAFNATLPGHTHDVPAHYHGIGAGAGLLTTAGTSGNGTAHSHTVDPAAFNTTDGAGGHNHGRGGTGAVGGNNYGLIMQSSGTSNTIASTDVSVGEPNVVTSPRELGLSTDGAHNHSIDVPNTSTSSESSHQHPIPSASVTGTVGLVSGGQNGNSAFATGSSSAANVSVDPGATTVTGTVSSNTISTNDPFQVVNYIIKATNTATATVTAVNLSAGTFGQTLYYNSGWTPTSNLYNNGTNVGIGNSSPAYKLDVTGSINATGSVYLPSNAGSATNRLYLSGVDANHYLYSSGTGGNQTYFGEYGGTFHFVNTNGGADVFTLNGTTVNIPGLSANGTVYTDASKNLTTTAPTTGTIGYWARSGSNLTTVNSGDNVGIGVTPGGKLHVNGQTRISGPTLARLTIEPENATQTNIWNMDNQAGLLRIFREDWAASGAGINGLLGMTISNAGVVSINQLGTGVVKATGGVLSAGTLSAADLSAGITGTPGRVARFTGANTLGNSLIQDDGTNIGLNAAPSASAKVNVGGSVAMNDNVIALRGPTDPNHGLGWYGASNLFNTVSVDGPVLFGCSGGALGIGPATGTACSGTLTGAARAVLSWNSAGNVGINNTAPLGPLSIGNSSVSGSDGYMVIGKNNGSGGTRQMRLGFNSTFDFVIGDYGNGNVAGTWTSPFLLNYSAPSNSLTVNSAGNVGVGVASATSKLQVAGQTATNTLKVNTFAGFTANKAAGQSSTTTAAFVEMTNWVTTPGANVLFNTGSFNTSTGRFTAPRDGYYYFSAQIRIDGISNATGSYARVMLAKNGSVDFNNGLHAIYPGFASGDLYLTATVSGVIKLAANEYVSVWCLSQGDASWVMQSESGFSGYIISDY